MVAPRRIGLLGGTFDPIHAGHLDVARAAQRQLELTAVHVLPANVPPHRPQPVASVFHRFAMAALAVAGNKGWRVSDIELRMPVPSFTAHTLERYRERGYTADELYFLIGADAFRDLPHWHDYPAILDAARFVVVSRPGFEVRQPADSLTGGSLTAGGLTGGSLTAGGLTGGGLTGGGLTGRRQADRAIFIDAQTTDVSSSAIRRARAEGRPIDGMVPPAVQQHIEQHGLYTPMPPDRRLQERREPTAADKLHG